MIWTNGKIKFDYDDICVFAKELADKLTLTNEGKDFVTFTKGGLFSSAFVCNYLKWKPMVISIGKDDLAMYDVGSVVVIDDILDTGKTTKKFLDKNDPDLPCFYLTDKPNTNRVFTPKVYYSSYTIKNEAWAVFPWEL